MATARRYIAFDLGASNGRGILGRFDGERLAIEAVHRFDNRPVELNGRFFWDILGLYQNILAGLVKMRQAYSGEFASLGVDTWGCDFALLDRQGKLAGNPYSYRDPHSRGIFSQAFQRMSREQVFRYTGLQFMELNSLYQLYAMLVHQDPILEQAAHFVMVPDLLHYWLSGELACEYTDASTSQLLDVHQRQWALPVIEGMGLRRDLFPELVQPGGLLGELRAAVAGQVGMNLPLAATATHDTASAVVAVPAENERFAYISSGTWALLGMEIDEPLVTPQVLDYNFTNEGGAFGKIRLLRNIHNLFLIQECRQHWAAQGELLSWEALAGLAEIAQPFLACLDPDDPRFLSLGDMPATIQQYCRETGQAVPQSKGEIIRTVLESLAFKYRYTFERLKILTGRSVDTMHIVGGGARNRLLNKFAANAMQVRVLAGPEEATAAGNVLVQMAALGDLASLNQARQVVQRSFSLQEYLPQDDSNWAAAYQAFIQACGLE